MTAPDARKLRRHLAFGLRPNQVGGFISKEQTAEAVQKPDYPLIGQDGNIFNLMGIASRTLKQNGLADQAKKMCDRHP